MELLKKVLLVLVVGAIGAIGAAFYGPPGADQYVSCDQLTNNERCTMARPGQKFLR